MFSPRSKNGTSSVPLKTSGPCRKPLKTRKKPRLLDSPHTTPTQTLHTTSTHALTLSTTFHQPPIPYPKHTKKNIPYTTSRRYERIYNQPDIPMGPFPRNYNVESRLLQGNSPNADQIDHENEYSDGLSDHSGVEDGDIPRIDPQIRRTYQMPPSTGRVMHNGDTLFTGPLCTDIFITLHSNMGDRPFFLRQAIEYLRELPETQITAVSPFYATPGKKIHSKQRKTTKFTCSLRMTSSIVPRSLVLELDKIQSTMGKPPKSSTSLEKQFYPINIDLISYGSLSLEASTQVDAIGLTLPHRSMGEIEVSYSLSSLLAINPNPCMSAYGSAIKHNDLWNPRENLALTHYLTFVKTAKPIMVITPIFKHKTFNSSLMTRLLEQERIQGSITPGKLDLYQTAALNIHNWLPHKRTLYSPYDETDSSQHRTRVLPPNTLTSFSLQTWEHPYITKFRNYNATLSHDENTIKDVISIDDTNGLTKRPFFRIGSEIYDALTLNIIPKPSTKGVDYLNPSNNIDITNIIPFPLTFLTFPPHVRIPIIQALHRIAQGVNLIDITAHTLDPMIDHERHLDDQSYSVNDVIWFLRQCIDYWEHLKLFTPVNYDSITDKNTKKRQLQRKRMQTMRKRVQEQRAREAAIKARGDINDGNNVYEDDMKFDELLDSSDDEAKPDVRVDVRRWVECLHQYDQLQRDYIREQKVMKNSRSKNGQRIENDDSFSNNTDNYDDDEYDSYDNGVSIHTNRTSFHYELERMRKKRLNLALLDNRSPQDRRYLTRFIQRAFEWDMKHPIYITSKNPLYKQLGLHSVDRFEELRGDSWFQDEFDEWSGFFNLTTSPTRSLSRVMSTVGTQERGSNEQFDKILHGLIDPPENLSTTHQLDMSVPRFADEHHLAADPHMTLTQESKLGIEAEIKKIIFELSHANNNPKDVIFNPDGTKAILPQWGNIKQDNHVAWRDEFAIYESLQHNYRKLLLLQVDRMSSVIERVGTENASQDAVTKLLNSGSAGKLTKSNTGFEVFEDLDLDNNVDLDEKIFDPDAESDLDYDEYLSGEKARQNSLKRNQLFLLKQQKRQQEHESLMNLPPIDPPPSPPDFQMLNLSQHQLLHAEYDYLKQLQQYHLYMKRMEEIYLPKPPQQQKFQGDHQLEYQKENDFFQQFEISSPQNIENMAQNQQNISQYNQFNQNIPQTGQFNPNNFDNNQMMNEPYNYHQTPQMQQNIQHQDKFTLQQQFNPQIEQLIPQIQQQFNPQTPQPPSNTLQSIENTQSFVNGNANMSFDPLNPQSSQQLQEHNDLIAAAIQFKENLGFPSAKVGNNSQNGGKHEPRSAADILKEKLGLMKNKLTPKSLQSIEESHKLSANTENNTELVVPGTVNIDSTQDQYHNFLKKREIEKESENKLLYGEDLSLATKSWAPTVDPIEFLGKFDAMVHENRKKSLKDNQKDIYNAQKDDNDDENQFLKVNSQLKSEFQTKREQLMNELSLEKERNLEKVSRSNFDQYDENDGKNEIINKNQPQSLIDRLDKIKKQQKSPKKEKINQVNPEDMSIKKSTKLPSTKGDSFDNPKKKFNAPNLTVGATLRKQIVDSSKQADVGIYDSIYPDEYETRVLSRFSSEKNGENNGKSSKSSKSGKKLNDLSTKEKLVLDVKLQLGDPRLDDDEQIIEARSQARMAEIQQQFSRQRDIKHTELQKKRSMFTAENNEDNDDNDNFDDFLRDDHDNDDLPDLSPQLSSFKDDEDYQIQKKLSKTQKMLISLNNSRSIRNDEQSSKLLAETRLKAKSLVLNPKYDPIQQGYENDYQNRYLKNDISNKNNDNHNSINEGGYTSRAQVESLLKITPQQLQHLSPQERLLFQKQITKARALSESSDFKLREAEESYNSGKNDTNMAIQSLKRQKMSAQRIPSEAFEVSDLDDYSDDEEGDRSAAAMRKNHAEGLFYGATINPNLEDIQKNNKNMTRSSQSFRASRLKRYYNSHDNNNNNNNGNDVIFMMPATSQGLANDNTKNQYMNINHSVGFVMPGFDLSQAHQDMMSSQNKDFDFSHHPQQYSKPSLMKGNVSILRPSNNNMDNHHNDNENNKKEQSNDDIINGIINRIDTPRPKLFSQSDAFYSEYEEPVELNYSTRETSNLKKKILSSPTLKSDFQYRLAEVNTQLKQYESDMRRNNQSGSRVVQNPGLQLPGEDFTRGAAFNITSANDINISDRDYAANLKLQLKHQKQSFATAKIPLSHLYPRLQLHTSTSSNINVTGTPLLSVHTCYATNMLRGVLSGADMVHDFGFGAQDDGVFDVLAALDIPVITGHMRGELQTHFTPHILNTYRDQSELTFDTKDNDVYTAQARSFANPFLRGVAYDFEQFLHHAGYNGLGLYNIIVDPGLGLSKNYVVDMAIPNNITSLLPPALPLPMMYCTNRLPSITRILSAQELQLSQNQAELLEKNNQYRSSKHDPSSFKQSASPKPFKYNPHSNINTTTSPTHFGPHQYRIFDPWTYENKITQDLQQLVNHMKYTYNEEQVMIENTLLSTSLYSTPANQLLTQIPMYGGTSSRLAIVGCNDTRKARLTIEMANNIGQMENWVRDQIKM